jgi:hypothetical protein
VVDVNRYTHKINNYKNNLLDIEKNLDHFLSKTIDIGKEFGGPSIYFHKEAIKAINTDFLGKRHLEMIYAMLPAWGMHRMGDMAAKVVDYTIFIEEINKNRDELNVLKNKTLQEVDINDIVELINEKIHVSTSNSYLVSSTKVLHHIIPNIISPIDRQYSIRFINENKNHFSNNTMQLNVVTEEVYAFIFIDGMRDFLYKNEPKMKNYLDDNFNTSITKIFDNLLVAYIKEYKRDASE